MITSYAANVVSMLQMFHMCFEFSFEDLIVSDVGLFLTCGKLPYYTFLLHCCFRNDADDCFNFLTHCRNKWCEDVAVVHNCYGYGER
jgi:hypothetical protein